MEKKKIHQKNEIYTNNNDKVEVVQDEDVRLKINCMALCQGKCLFAEKSFYLCVLEEETWRKKYDENQFTCKITWVSCKFS